MPRDKNDVPENDFCIFMLLVVFVVVLLYLNYVSIRLFLSLEIGFTSSRRLREICSSLVALVVRLMQSWATVSFPPPLEEEVINFVIVRGRQGTIGQRKVEEGGMAEVEG